MQTISVREANQNFSRYLNAVDHGEELIITKRGREIARVLPGKDAAVSPVANAQLHERNQQLWRQLWADSAASGVHGPFERDAFYD